MGPKLLLYIWEEPKAPWRQGLKFKGHRPAPRPSPHPRGTQDGRGGTQAQGAWAEPDLLDGGVTGSVGQAAEDAAL